MTKSDIRRTALLVIDPINSSAHPACEKPEWGVTFRKIRKTIPALKAFIEEYRERGGPVVFTTCVPWTKKHLPANINALYRDNPQSYYYSNDTSGFPEAVYHIVPKKGEPVIVKNTYDAFTNPTLDAFLRHHRVKTILIAGFFADGCVHATLQGGFSKGHSFLILKDLIETTDKPARQQLQRALKNYTWPVLFGKTISSTEVWRELT